MIPFFGTNNRDKDPKDPVPSVTDPFDVKIGLSESQRKSSAAKLQSMYANSVFLGMKIVTVRFNLKGINFHQMKEFMNELAKCEKKLTKKIGKNVRSLGYFVPGDFEEMKKLSCIGLVTGEVTAKQRDQKLLKILLEDVENIVRCYSEWTHILQEQKVYPVADFMNEVTRDYLKIAWMLRTHLEERGDSVELE